jgi:hypothetical protein
MEGFTASQESVPSYLKYRPKGGKLVRGFAVSLLISIFFEQLALGQCFIRCVLHSAPLIMTNSQLD